MDIAVVLPVDLTTTLRARSGTCCRAFPVDLVVKPPPVGRPPEGRGIEQVRAHPERPFLFIHCDADTVVLVHHSRDLMAASANRASSLWIVPGCEHVKAHETRPAEFESRVLAFLASQLR